MSPRSPVAWSATTSVRSAAPSPIIARCFQSPSSMRKWPIQSSSRRGALHCPNADDPQCGKLSPRIFGFQLAELSRTSAGRVGCCVMRSSVNNQAILFCWATPPSPALMASGTLRSTASDSGPREQLHSFQAAIFGALMVHPDHHSPFLNPAILV
jgi:hypothetical protein